MESRLVNVRLDPERIRKAKILRERGIAVSELLREAIDRRYRELIEGAGRRDAETILAELDRRFPIIAEELPARPYSVHSRKEATEAIRRRLVSPRRR